MQFDGQSFRRLSKTVQRSEREPFQQRRRPRPRFTPFGDTLPTVPCVNGSGLVIPAYGLVKKSSVVSGAVTCVRPDTTWGTYLVNGSSDVPIGGTFRGYCTGQVTVLGTAGGTGQMVGPIPNSFGAKSGSPLIHLMLAPASGLYLGSLCPPQVLYGKPLANISAGGSGSMIVYDNTRTAITPQITVAISYAVASLTTSKLMSAGYNAGAWYGFPGEC